MTARECKDPYPVTVISDSNKVIAETTMSDCCGFAYLNCADSPPWRGPRATNSTETLQKDLHYGHYTLPDFIRAPTSSTDCYRRLLKRTCSRVTSASSALGVLNDYALYKPTHSLSPRHVDGNTSHCYW